MDKDLEFKPEDFNDVLFDGNYELQQDVIAEKANQLLAEHLAKCPEVRYPSMEDEWACGDFNEDYPWQKRARLVCIEDIK